MEAKQAPLSSFLKPLSMITKKFCNMENAGDVHEIQFNISGVHLEKYSLHQTFLHTYHLIQMHWPIFYVFKPYCGSETLPTCRMGVSNYSFYFQEYLFYIWASYNALYIIMKFPYTFVTLSK